MAARPWWWLGISDKSYPKYVRVSLHPKRVREVTSMTCFSVDIVSTKVLEIKTISAWLNFFPNLSL
jgi:hypothetical protein